MSNLWIFILVGIAIIIVLVALILVIRKLIKLRKKKYEIPTDIMQDLKRVEEIFNASGGTITPQEAMLKLYKEKLKGGSNGKTKIIQETTGSKTTTSDNSSNAGTTTASPASPTTTTATANQYPGTGTAKQNFAGGELHQQLAGRQDVPLLPASGISEIKSAINGGERDFGEVGRSHRKRRRRRIFPRREQ